MSLWDRLLGAADGDRLQAGEVMLVQLMRGDVAACKAGYSLRNALHVMQTAMRGGAEPGSAAFARRTLTQPEVATVVAGATRRLIVEQQSAPLATALLEIHRSVGLRDDYPEAVRLASDVMLGHGSDVMTEHAADMGSERPRQPTG